MLSFMPWVGVWHSQLTSSALLMPACGILQIQISRTS